MKRVPHVVLTAMDAARKKIGLDETHFSRVSRMRMLGIINNIRLPLAQGNSERFQWVVSNYLISEPDCTTAILDALFGELGICTRDELEVILRQE